MCHETVMLINKRIEGTFYGDFLTKNQDILDLVQVNISKRLRKTYLGTNKQINIFQLTH